MRERDHDLMGHGWRWTEAWTYSREEERALIPRAIETFERVLGSRPIGWNSRGWPSENTRGILHELGGFLYHSEGCADDLPVLRDGRRRRADPRDPVLQDLQRLALPHEPGLREPARLPRDDGWGLDELVREGDERPTMMTVAVHERWSGQAARASALRQFIEHAQAHRGRAASCAAATSRAGGSSTYPPR